MCWRLLLLGEISPWSAPRIVDPSWNIDENALNLLLFSFVEFLPLEQKVVMGEVASLGKLDEFGCLFDSEEL